MGYRYNILSLVNAEDFDVMRLVDQFNATIENYNGEVSDLVLVDIRKIILNTIHYQQRGGNSYIITPFINHTIINIHNKDNECFKWSILAYFYLLEYPSEDHLDRVSKYKNSSSVLIEKYNINFNKIVYPMALDKIKYFEKQNPDIQIRVYEKLSKEVRPVPLYVKSDNRKYIINLLLILEKDEEVITNSHYCLIRNFNAFLNPDTSNQKYYCPLCLNHCSTQDYLDKHMELCNQNEPQQATYPERNKDGSRPILKFINFNRQFKHPFVAVADFECIVEKYNDPHPVIDKQTKSIKSHKIKNT